tara:strand:- start:167 stop:811 length:645 start_codon:yes stop_codon:yes gene_type:complete
MRITFTSAEEYELSGFHFGDFDEREFVVFDLEATGPDAEQDSVTQFGTVRVGDEEQTFEGLVKPWKSIPEKIEKLTGVTNQRVTEAESFAVVFERFRKFCGDAVLVTSCGYEYDFPLLEKECARSGLKKLPNERLDTKAIFAMLHPDRGETFSTNFLSEYYQIDRRVFNRHDALGDAKLVARIFYAELKEAKAMGMNSLEAEGVRIKRFLLSSL